VIALAAAPARPQAGAVTQKQIDAAIDKGVAHLLEQYVDGEGRDPHLQPGSPLTVINRPGLRALTVYALLQSGVGPRHAVVEKLVGRLSFERFDNTYDVACMLLALEALDPVGQRAWIDELAAFLVAHREKSGEFGYPGGGDLSNTQFGALGLRAAAKAGVPIAADVWDGLARAVLKHQCKDKGFSYTMADGHSTDTMTAAGVGVLAVCEVELVRSGKLDAELAASIRRARTDGLAWLAKRLGISNDVDHASWKHYFLYGLERVGGLCGVEMIGEHDWYAEGAKFLVDTQDGNGEWHGGFERAPTLFALLFLARATSTAETRERSAPATGPRPVVVQHPHTKGTDTPGGMRLEVRGTQPLRMWLTHLVCPANAPFEWPDERGRGPHVALVEYFADGAPIAAVLADPTRAARDQTFACEHRGLAPGKHQLTARVHVRAPGARASGGSRRSGGAPAREPSEADLVLTTNGVDVEIPADAHLAIVEPVFDPALDLLTSSRAKATASTTISGTPAWEDWSFSARLAVDGNPRTPWIASREDPNPFLKVQVTEPQRANLLRIAPARLSPRSPAFLTLPREISVTINGGAARTIALDEKTGAWIDIKLERQVLVGSIEIRLVGRETAGASVGIGEVVLQLTTD
jgi:hypothetical protein